MTWRDEALCATGSLLWLVDRPTPRQKQWMASVCAACPVKAPCIAEAEKWRTTYQPPRTDMTVTYPTGVWGGQYYGGKADRAANPVPILLHETVTAQHSKTPAKRRAS